MPGVIHCKRCPRSFRTQAKFASHMWEHRREDKAAAAKAAATAPAPAPKQTPVKRPYTRKAASVAPCLTCDRSIMEAALVGYQHQLGVIDGKMAEVQAALGGGGRRGIADPGPSTPTHRISDEGRARIAAAQRRRWADVKKGAMESPATPVAG